VAAALLVATALAFEAGCDGSEPVLSGVKDVPSVEQVEMKHKAEVLRASPKAIDAAYAKAAGVYIDVRYFGGRDWDAVRDEVERQFGAVKAETPGVTGERVIELERGSIALRAGKIQTVIVPLPEPMRRSEALAALGFPAFVEKYNELSTEFRLTNQWGFRRITFVRASRGAEEVVRVEARKFSTDDH
jgi:hypothetical protein